MTRAARSAVSRPTWFRKSLGDRFVSLPRGRLAAEIYRSIEGRNEVSFGDTVTGLSEHEHGVHVTFGNGSTRAFARH